MRQCGFFIHQATQFRVYSQNRLTQEDASQIGIVILAIGCLTADARIHQEDIFRFINEVFYHFRRGNDISLSINRFIDDHPVLGQIEQSVPTAMTVKQGAFHHPADQGPFGHLRAKIPQTKTLLQ